MTSPSSSSSPDAVPPSAAAAPSVPKRRPAAPRKSSNSTPATARAVTEKSAPPTVRVPDDYPPLAKERALGILSYIAETGDKFGDRLTAIRMSAALNGWETDPATDTPPVEPDPAILSGLRELMHGYYGGN